VEGNNLFEEKKWSEHAQKKGGKRGRTTNGLKTKKKENFSKKKSRGTSLTPERMHKKREQKPEMGGGSLTSASKGRRK